MLSLSALFLAISMVTADCTITPQIGYDDGGGAYVRFYTDCENRQFCHVTWDDGWEDEYVWITRRRPTQWIAIELPYEIICGEFTEDVNDVKGPNSPGH